MPHSARIYDYWLGGKDNFAVDRAVGEAMIQAIPGMRYMAGENRKFVHRAARDLVAKEGIRQFLDIGTGIPTRPNLHEIAQQIAPETRVVYVDNDPIVLVHARALMISTTEGRSEYISADIRDPQSILNEPVLATTLDLTEPVGLTLIAILMLLADADDPWAKVAELRDAMPSGSCLAITHPTADFNARRGRAGGRGGDRRGHDPGRADVRTGASGSSATGSCSSRAWCRCPRGGRTSRPTTPRRRTTGPERGPQALTWTFW